MTLRRACEELGLRLVYDLSPLGFRCLIADVRVDDTCGKSEAAADGETRRKAYRALSRFVSGRLLRSTVRHTTLYWVPPLELKE